MALAAKGKQAATTNRVIHLARPPSSSAASVGVLAHELVHARTATHRTRFLDDPQIDEEERVARAVEASVSSAAKAGESTEMASNGVARAAGMSVPPVSADAEAADADGVDEADETGIPVDMDELLMAMEERILAQLDRRGGRYAGVF